MPAAPDRLRNADVAALKELTGYLDRYLEVRRFRDYCPNGLQLEGRAQVNSLVSGVTACLELVEAAVAEGADAVLVHHGYFWKGEPAPLVGMKARRVRRLLETGTSLLAYHLPLDAHPEVGNNACLARELNLQTEGALDDDQAAPLALFGRTAAPLEPSAFAREIERALGRAPLWIPGAAAAIRTVGWCTGAAQDYIHYAVARGLDAFVSGEVSERTTHIAREEGVHYFAAGHHATERYGVQALGEHLAGRFSLTHRFIEVANPV